MSHRVASRLWAAVLLLLAAATTALPSTATARAPVWALPPSNTTAESTVLYADNFIGVLWIEGVGLQGLRWSDRHIANWTLPAPCPAAAAGKMPTRPTNAFATRTGRLAYVCVSESVAMIAQIELASGEIVVATPFASPQALLFPPSFGLPQASASVGTFCYLDGWCVFPNGTFWAIPQNFKVEGMPGLSVYRDTIAVYTQDVILYSATTGHVVGNVTLPPTSGYGFRQRGRYFALQIAPRAVGEALLTVIDLETRARLPTDVPCLGFAVALMVGTHETNSNLTIVGSLPSGDLNVTYRVWTTPLSAFSAPVAAPLPFAFQKVMPPPSSTVGTEHLDWGQIGEFYVTHGVENGHGQLFVIELATGKSVRVETPLQGQGLAFRATNNVVLASTNGTTQALSLAGTLWRSTVGALPPSPAGSPPQDPGSDGCFILAEDFGATSSSSAPRFGFICVV